eukprot:5596849-Pyramimonas_sp.AAC.1
MRALVSYFFFASSCIYTHLALKGPVPTPVSQCGGHEAGDAAAPEVDLRDGERAGARIHRHHRPFTWLPRRPVARSLGGARALGLGGARVLGLGGARVLGLGLGGAR